MSEPYAFVRADNVPTAVLAELRDGGWIHELTRQWPGVEPQPWYRLPPSVAHDLLPGGASAPAAV